MIVSGRIRQCPGARFRLLSRGVGGMVRPARRVYTLSRTWARPPYWGAVEVKEQRFMAAVSPLQDTDLDFDHGTFDAAGFTASALANWQTLAAVVDHTMLKPDATREQVE